MVQIVICCSLFTLNVILNLLLYAVNISDIHVCQKPDFLKMVISFLFFFFFFIRQSVIVFQETGKNKKKKGRNR